MLGKANKLGIHGEKGIVFIVTLKLLVNFPVKHLLPPRGNAHLSQLELNTLNGFNDILLENRQAFCWSAHLYPE